MLLILTVTYKTCVVAVDEPAKSVNKREGRESFLMSAWIHRYLYRDKGCFGDQLIAPAAWAVQMVTCMVHLYYVRSTS